MPHKSERTTPRPFTLHWGSGRIVEEATYSGEHHEPTFQLLEFDDGSLSVRFCYYDHAGRFQRMPLIVNKGEADGLRQALARTPRLRSLLKEMVG